jgi:hypothetical protein
LSRFERAVARSRWMKVMSTEQKDDEDSEANEPSSDMMPAVPEALGLDPLLLALLRCASFLDLTAEEGVNPELAGEVLEHVGMYIQRLPDERLDEIQSDLETLEAHAAEQGWPGDLVEFIRDFLYNCGLGEDEADEPLGEA